MARHFHQFFPISLLKITHNQSLEHCYNQSWWNWILQKKFLWKLLFFPWKKYKLQTKRNFSTSCSIRLPLNIYELKTSLFFRTGISPRESVSFCAVSWPSAFLFSSFPSLLSQIVQGKRSCEPLFLLNWGLLFLFPVPSTSSSLESARFAVIWDSYSK